MVSSTNKKQEISSSRDILIDYVIAFSLTNNKEEVRTMLLLFYIIPMHKKSKYYMYRRIQKIIQN